DGVLYKSCLAIIAGDRNQRALRCSDAYGENSHTHVGRFFGHLYSITAQFFAIGKDDESSIPGSAFAEALHGQSNGAGDIGSAFGNRLRVQIIDGLNDGVVINRKWCLQKSAAGESDQANAVALKVIDQILDGKLDALEPVRLDVIGKHAARCVHSDQQVEPFTLYILKSVTPSRLSETDNSQ